MGNLQTRKRPADESLSSPIRKRIRLDCGFNGNGTEDSVLRKTPIRKSSITMKVKSDIPEQKQRLPRLSHVLAYSTGRLHRTHEIYDNVAPEHIVRAKDRCLSLELPHAQDDAEDGYAVLHDVASCSTLNRQRDYPLPWLEAIFLPEFPSRSVINENSFVLANEIGAGAFGRVFRATALHDPRGIYAVKIQEKARILARQAALQVKREAAIQRLIKPHPFITRLYATWQSRSRLYSVLQYPVGGLGDLFQLWRDYGNLDETAIRIYAAEMACAIDFVHKSGVIYRDLKLENIVLDAEGHIQLVDFGLAKLLKNGERTSTVCGTLQYMSPDVSCGSAYSHYVDWWTLGVVIHILLCGKYPFPNAEATHHRQLRFIDYSTPIGCSKEMGNLLDRLLTANVERRLCSFEVLHAHPFFRSIDFEQVEARKYNPIRTIRGLGIRPPEKEPSPEVDGEENWMNFEEKYEFNKPEYFNDRM